MAPERLVMTLDCSEHPDAWHDMVKPNRARDERNPAGEMLSTVTFEDVDGKTKLTIRTRFESATIRDAMLKMGMTEGWTESLERLAAHLAKA
ncbi:SRPBCC domain-containing protein [Undibacterium arcticum]